MSDQRINQILSKILREMSDLDDIFIELNNTVKSNVCIDKKTPIEGTMDGIKSDAKIIKSAIRNAVSQNLYNKD